MQWDRVMLATILFENLHLRILHCLVALKFARLPRTKTTTCTQLSNRLLISVLGHRAGYFGTISRLRLYLEVPPREELARYCMMRSRMLASANPPPSLRIRNCELMAAAFTPEWLVHNAVPALEYLIVAPSI